MQYGLGLEAIIMYQLPAGGANNIGPMIAQRGLNEGTPTLAKLARQAVLCI